MRNFSVLLVCASIWSLTASLGLADNWPAWRGPRRDGISAEKSAPTRWSKTENVLWRTPLPGPAGATPIVWNDRIFLTSADGDALVLLSLDTTGKVVWKKTIGAGNRTVRDGEGNFAAPSPSTDGEHVWAFFGAGDLACYDFAGNKVWQFNLQDRYGKFNIQFGMASTPILDEDRLYVQCMYTGGSYVVALEKRTGKEIWKSNRPSDARAECEHSYASPFLYRFGGTSFLLSHGADYIVAHRLTDGGEIWRCGGMNPLDKYNPTLRFVASPTAVDGLIVVPTAKNGPVLALRPDSVGDITANASQRPWTRKDNTPDVPSPLIHDGLVYLCRENGVLICLDAKTGSQVYLERTHVQRHRSSPIFANGHVYLMAADGVSTVVKSGRDFQIVATNKLGETMAASPVLSNGVLYLRTYEALYAIGDRTALSSANAK